MVASASPRVTVGWAPHPGSQAAFLSCPAFEALYHGSRGPGKTDALLMDFAQHVGRGFGDRWRGVIFRRQFKDLATDLIPKSLRWFRQIFPDAKLIQGNTPEWRFATGEVLMFRHIKDKSGYWDYHGSEIPFVGWEELTQWPDDGAYEAMMSCCRSSREGMPRKYRATTNPLGVGHNWVKRRFGLDGTVRPGEVIRDDEGRTRVHLFGHLAENPSLTENDPEYVRTLRSITDPNVRKAWLEGSWDIVAGGMFDDLWDSKVHVIEPFPIPASWRIDRSFDWGSTSPFSVLWWAQGDGTGGAGAPLAPRGTLYLIAEWYGSNGRPNEGLRLPDTTIARGIVQREEQLGIRHRCRPGPADSAIFAKDPNTNDSIAGAMERAGVKWLPSDKSPGSRVRGVQAIRRLLAASRAERMEEPGLFVFSRCANFIRNFPVLPRDETNIEDVATDAEDHDFDAARYRVLHTAPRSKAVAAVGMF